MRANQVSLLTAAYELGTDMRGAAAAFGYTGLDGFSLADKEVALTFVECVAFYVYVQGSAEAIGLSEASLQRYFDLRKLNDLAFVPTCGEDAGMGALLVSALVWTVGNDYPVAYHVAIDSMLVAPEGVNDNPYSDAYLGYARSTQMRGEIEGILQETVRELALQLAALR